MGYTEDDDRGERMLSEALGIDPDLPPEEALKRFRDPCGMASVGLTRLAKKMSAGEVAIVDTDDPAPPPKGNRASRRGKPRKGKNRGRRR